MRSLGLGTQGHITIQREVTGRGHSLRATDVSATACADTVARRVCQRERECGECYQYCTSTVTANGRNVE
jgi:hypothetical protein